MWKKAIVAVLVLTIAAAVVVAVIDNMPSALAAGQPAADATPMPAASGNQFGGGGQGAGQHGQSNQGSGAAVQQQLNQSVDNVGEAWTAAVTVVELGDVGMNGTLEDGTPLYIELGPSFFWQEQGTLAPGDVVTVDGFYNGDQYHAASITKTDGTLLALRSETGQPLWSGGASNTGGAQHGDQANGGTGEVQIAPEDWVTLDATVLTVNRNGLTIQSADGETLALSFGKASFWQEQAVQFAAGDAVSIQGFWQDGQFQTGQVTKVETGERILLRDPNGRPLWGGPGRQGGKGGQSAPVTG